MNRENCMNHTEELKCCPVQKEDKHIIAMLMDNAEKISVSLNLATAIQNNLIGGRNNDVEIVYGGKSVRADLNQQSEALDALIKHLEGIYRVMGIAD